MSYDCWGFLFFVFFLSSCIYAEEADYLAHSNSEKIQVRSSLTYHFAGNTDDIKSLLIIDLPLPETNIYQNIKELKISTSKRGHKKIQKHPETKKQYVSGSFERLGKTAQMTIEFEAELFDVKVDFSKITEIYPYEKKGEIYKAYTGVSGNCINPHNSDIQKIGKKIGSESKDNLDYAEKCYLYVAENFRYSSDNVTDDLNTVMQRRYGICGNYTYVYVSLLRYRGIPARAVYGLDPKSKDTTFGISRPAGHAWAEFYLEKYGWIPVDVTAKSCRKNENYFGFKPKRFVVTSFGTDVSCLSCDGDKLQLKKVNYLHRYYSRLWSNQAVRSEMFFEFEQIKP